jgi:hypothetical protein
MDLRDARGTAECHRSRQFVAEHSEYGSRPLLTAGGQSPEDGPPYQDGVRPEGQGPQNIGARSDASVDKDRGASPDRVDNLGEGASRCDRAVELTSSVVGDDHAGGAVLDRAPGVITPDESFDHDGEPAPLGRQRQVVERDRGIEGSGQRHEVGFRRIP